MRKTTTGILALSVVGFYYLFRNRDRVMKFLNEQGIHFPSSATEALDQIKAGASDVVEGVKEKIGVTEHKVGDKLRRAG